MKGWPQSMINKVQMERELVYMKLENSDTNNLMMVLKTFQQHFLLFKNH